MTASTAKTTRITATVGDPSALLSVRGLTVAFGATVAVAGVDLDVADGDVLALLGPSGCGKSTLLRAVAGIEHPRSGTISSYGRDLSRVPVHRRGFGLMFQDGVLFPHRTVAGNIGYGLRGRADATRRIDELLDLVGLSGFGTRQVAGLSGGEAQRVALARALAPGPRLLLLDEPLAALDAALRVHLLADLRRILTTTGTAAVFVTHDQEEAFAIADRIALMRAGRIVQVDRPAAVWAHPVDEAAARFTGCTAVLDAVPEAGRGGTWRSVLPGLGTVPGRSARVGLRPSALRADPAGPLIGEIVSVVPGPAQSLLAVRIAGTGGADGAAAAVSALAPAAVDLSAGGTVRLRFEAAGAAPIGTGIAADTS